MVNDQIKKHVEMREIQRKKAYELMGERNYKEAENIWKTYCKNYQTLSSDWINLAACLKATGSTNQAYKIIKEAIKVEPNKILCYHTLSQCQCELNEIEAAKRTIGQIITKQCPTRMSLQEISNIQFNGIAYDIVSENILKEIAHKWENSIIQSNAYNIWGDRLRDKKDEEIITVGYMSGDFCEHPVGKFIMTLIENTNQKKFRIVGIDTGSKHDEVNRLLRGICDGWIDVCGETSIDAARKIANTQIDCIIELGGYTGNNRLDILCHKPANIQFSYLGYFGPTYLSCIDGWIGDKEVFGGYEQKDGLLMIEGGYMAYEDRYKVKIKTDRIGNKVVLGCFNNTRKLTNETVDLFSEILSVNEGTKLMIKSLRFNEEQERKRIMDEFKKRMIRSDQIEIVEPSKDIEAHLNLYNSIDIALDTIPYGGATTSCEALAMGIPVITKRGKDFKSRLTSSILVGCGMEEYVCNTKSEFMEKTQRLIQKGQRSKEQRMNISRRFLTSSMNDGRRLARAIEEIISQSLTNQL